MIVIADKNQEVPVMLEAGKDTNVLLDISLPNRISQLFENEAITAVLMDKDIRLLTGDNARLKVTLKRQDNQTGCSFLTFAQLFNASFIAGQEKELEWHLRKFVRLFNPIKRYRLGLRPFPLINFLRKIQVFF